MLPMAQPTDIAKVPIKLLTPAQAPNLTGCLLFVSDREGSSQIFLMTSGTTKQLTDAQGENYDPSWSPGGNEIAFVSSRDKDIGTQIYVMNQDGSNQHQLGDVQPGNNSHPNWSRADGRLIFQSDRGIAQGTLDAEGFDIYLMDTDGRNVSPLIQLEGDQTEPVWSPNGYKVAFLSSHNGGEAGIRCESRWVRIDSDHRHSGRKDGPWLVKRWGLCLLYKRGTDLCGQHVHAGLDPVVIPEGWQYSNTCLGTYYEFNGNVFESTRSLEALLA